MGTTLTGTTPQDTYDSLIKVTDNGPLSGTLKKLTDGLGNDSSLSLSTTAASFSGNVNALGSFNGFAGATQNLLIDWSSSSQMTTLTNTELFFGTNANRRLTISAAGNVGIGTSSPAGNLHIASASDTGIRIQGSASGLSYIDLADTASGTPAGSIAYNHISNAIVFATDTNVERARITSNGLSFNGDTAAANALDDYEEGTWTMGISFGGASVGVVYGTTTGNYTKIGRQVTVTGYLSLNNKGTSTGTARVTGLPFAIGTGGQFSAAANGFLNIVSYTGNPQLVGLSGSSVVELYQLSEAGSLTDITNANFANLSEVYLSFTYFTA